MANVKTKKKPRNKPTVKAKAKTTSSMAKQKPAKEKPEETMDRAALKGVATQLKGAGVDIKVLKGDSDEVVQRKVNEALQRLPSEEVLKKLEAVDPNKLVSVLKLDCLGVFIDLSDVSCVRCRDASSCVTKFIANVKNGFRHLDRAIADDGKVEAGPKATTKVTAVTRYDAKRAVYVRDVPNPNPKGDDYHDSIQRILDETPDTLGELRAILEDDFDFDGDGDFMRFVTALRDPGEGVIKLDVDLSEEDKAALKAAGYDI
ncbi:MAG TPA: hypothetical protein VIU64_09380 [Polyangia bacterium]